MIGIEAVVVLYGSEVPRGASMETGTTSSRTTTIGGGGRTTRAIVGVGDGTRRMTALDRVARIIGAVDEATTTRMTRPPDDTGTIATMTRTFLSLLSSLDTELIERQTKTQGDGRS